MNQHSKLLLVLLAVSSLALSACSEKKPVTKADSQVAMKVNGEPINSAEFDANSGNLPGEHSHAISGPRLSKLIDMELLRQAAVQSKLDADPNIQARIATVNRMVLATAYMQKQLESVGKPTESEISDYFKQNPARFAERKQYEINEFSIQPPPGKAAEIQAQLGKSKNAQAFDQWLTGNSIPHQSTPVSVTSDRLSDDVLQKLKNVPVGGTAVVGNNNQMNVLFVLAEQQQPIALAQAKPAVSNMLLEKRKKEALDNSLKQLRDKAKIDYVPPYSANGFSAAVEKE